MSGREPEEVLLRAAQDAMREAALSLRRRGWPIELIIDRIPERDSFAVSLRFELPHIPHPIEGRLRDTRQPYWNHASRLRFPGWLVIVFVHKAHETLESWRGPDVGRLLSPRQYSRAADTAHSGRHWAADNDCFQGLDATAYQSMLDAIHGLPGCKFVVAPDVVEDWKATRERFEEWYDDLVACWQPIAYVIQDGQPATEVPWSRFDCLFVGGSSEYKCSDDAHDLVRMALARDCWVHMGRVNTAQRMTLAKSWGCHSIDGTSVSMYTNRRLPERLAQARAPRQLNLREAS